MAIACKLGYCISTTEGSNSTSKWLECKCEYNCFRAKIVRKTRSDGNDGEETKKDDETQSGENSTDKRKRAKRITEYARVVRTEK